jgi:hypothetical protein
MLNINLEGTGRGSRLKGDMQEALSKLMKGAKSVRGCTEQLKALKIDFRLG